MADTVPANIALWKPFPKTLSKTPLVHDIVCVHTMVGSLEGSYNYASQPGNSYWHFGTSGLGECWQCQDLRYRSAANLNGNWRVIPIENADMGPGFGSWNGKCGFVPAFTQAQVNKLVQLIAWLCIAYNIPPTLIPDTAQGRRGIAYHRQGIDPWRCSTCELWSSAEGKCCPDNARITQLINVIIPAVQVLIQGDVPLSADEVETIVNAINDARDEVLETTLETKPFFAQDYDLGDIVWLVSRDGSMTKRWVKQPGDTPEEQEFPGKAILTDLFNDPGNQQPNKVCNGVWPNGYPKAWPRDKAWLDLYETVGDVPPGWETQDEPPTP